MTIDLQIVDVVDYVTTARFTMPSDLNPGVVKFGINTVAGFAIEETRYRKCSKISNTFLFLF